jgi:hypothetical protein
VVNSNNASLVLVIGADAQATSAAFDLADEARSFFRRHKKRLLARRQAAAQ